MFTADGELREEFRERVASPPADAGPPPAEPRPTDPPPADPRRIEGSPDGGPTAGPLDPGPPAETDPGAPGFFDLVSLLAEPAGVYLRQASAADPQTAAQSLELARLHIDLLVLLRTKTEGNLSPAEKEALDDVIYQLRAGYVGLRS